MKKFIVSILVLSFSVVLFNCSSEDTESNVDFTEISESKLKDLILQEKANDNLIRLIKVDTPGGPQDCRVDVLSLLANLSPTDKNSILASRDIFYDIRDHDLDGTTTGEVYIEAYYYLSNKLKNEPVTMGEITRYFEILPTITSIKGKLDNQNYSGVVITENDRTALVSLVNYYKTKQVNDSNYQEILDVIIDDINSLTNRNSSQINDFLSN